MDFTTVIGVVGAVIVLVFFILNQFNKMSANNFYYDLGNFIGAAMLLWYALVVSAIPFIITNAVWALFSLKDVISGLKKR